MKITIHSEVLRQNSLSLGDFLVLLMGFHEINYEQTFKSLVDRGIVQSNVFDPSSMVMSNNTKNLVTSVLVQSDDRITDCDIDFPSLASCLQSFYPEGMKSGTTHQWRGTVEEIAQKLRTLTVTHNFSFSEQEAIAAVKEYVNSFKDRDRKNMMLLRNFILTTSRDSSSFSSMFMTIIENNR